MVLFLVLASICALAIDPTQMNQILIQVLVFPTQMLITLFASSNHGQGLVAVQ
jgi:hypothetical protein